MKIAIGGDHAGYDLKEYLRTYLEEKHEIIDFGPHSDDSTDYPPFAHAVSEAVEKNSVDFGILICGSANGVAMTANKHAHIRCAICWDVELATLAKAHNNANIIALPARFITEDKAKKIVASYMETEFEGGRHQRRVDKIPC
jgi:ribose 5-phosphate isomerase B